MKYFFLLSKENLELSKEEAISLLGIKAKLSENLLFCNLKLEGLEERLAYTNKIYHHLFSCKKNELEKNIDKFDWNTVYKGSYRVRKFNLDGYNEAQLADRIWNKLKNPKTDLSQPKTQIDFYVTKNTIHCGVLIKELKNDFADRKAHNRPALHPTSLHPKLARAIINLTGIKKGVLADLFCGAGGILLEAGLMGLKPVGYDLYSEMIGRAKINLKHYKIKEYKLECKDALKIKRKFNYIVSDLPYGLNTSLWVQKGKENKKIYQNKLDKAGRLKSIEDFYLSFLKNLKKVLKKKAVIILPHYVNYKQLIKKSNLKLEKEFSQFVHGSLTRKILVIS